MQRNFLYPFLWITGDSTDGLVDEISAFYESGARGFCVESRTCNDFCGEKWWNIMDFVLYEAKKRGMQVWLLDDKHYPTGYANDAVKNKYPDLRPWRVKCETVDLEGEAGDISLLLNSVSDDDNRDEILGVFAVKAQGRKAEIKSDMSRFVDGRFLRFKYDGKPIRICTVKKTRSGAERIDSPYYIDMLRAESVDVLIREVYEPHYEKYVESGKYNGTFCGFFSDEPRFGNGYNCGDLCNRNAYQSTLGTEGMTYPWSDELSQKFTPRELLSLWRETGENTQKIRIHYMNAITDAYGKNFSGRLAAWCRARNLTYCGHIIEDMGAHARLGCSAGHYFRSQMGADYAAVDVVLHQIKPYCRKKHFAPIAGGYADPEFFDNTLAKLASSCARLYSEKENRALCEIFGAYGWGESIDEMLYLVNHMLVRGINAFIPHAYSQTFPNDDCPPHFGRRTHLFGGYKLVMRYMQKMCELFSNERADIKVAILYHAEAEWSGKKYMTVDKVAAALAKRNIDFDILPIEKIDLADRYEHIIVPYAEYLSEQTELKLKRISCSAVRRLETYSDAELAVVANTLPRTLNLRGVGSEYVRVMKFAGEDKFFLHNENNRSVKLSAEFVGDACKVIDTLSGGEKVIGAKDGTISFSLHAGQAVILGRAQNIPSRKTVCRRVVGFEKAREDETCVIYHATLDMAAGDNLLYSYTGEWARVQIGNDVTDNIGGFGSAACSVAGERETTITIYKNFAYIMRDELSKQCVLRPARLISAQIETLSE